MYKFLYEEKKRLWALWVFLQGTKKVSEMMEIKGVGMGEEPQR